LNSVPVERYEALIFDLDGTLWDAAAASSDGWNLGLAELGLAARVTEDGVRSVCGHPFDRCIEILLPELHPASEALAEALDRAQHTVVRGTGGVLYPGVAEGLPRLAESYRLFLVSNCPDWYLEEFFRSTGLGVHLRGHDCHGSSGLGKSEMLIRLRRRHGIGRAIYLGDTPGDQEAAETAGLDFGFAAYGFGVVDGADLSFSSFDQLVEHFLRQR